jgi:hypothetical protein
MNNITGRILIFGAAGRIVTTAAAMAGTFDNPDHHSEELGSTRLAKPWSQRTPGSTSADGRSTQFCRDAFAVTTEGGPIATVATAQKFQLLVKLGGNCSWMPVKAWKFGAPTPTR